MVVYNLNFNLSIYFVLDPACCNGRPVEAVAEAALRGGITMLQYRDKEGAPGDIKANALKLQKLCQDYDVPFLINDHVALASEIGADGVHIGQDDLSPERAREMIGPDKILGLTAYTPGHLLVVDPEIVDYVGTGPFFETKTDKGKAVLGPEKFAEMIKHAPVPVVGIGGVTPENAQHVMDAGADGVAMMRSISEAADVEAATQRFKENVIPAKAGI